MELLSQLSTTELEKRLVISVDTVASETSHDIKINLMNFLAIFESIVTTFKSLEGSFQDSHHDDDI